MNSHQPHSVPQYHATYASSYPPPAMSSAPPPPRADERNPWVSFMPPLVAGAFILLAISCIGAVAGAKARKHAAAPTVATAQAKTAY